MTFQEVLNTFAEYLNENLDCEVIQTRHGYTVLVWDNGARNWDTSECCGTPEQLCEKLCEACFSFSALKRTHGERELTSSEAENIQAELEKMTEDLRQVPFQMGMSENLF